MQPEQMRAARAALNWSLDRLAEASGVHRNTLSNFETRKYLADQGTIMAAERALKAAGVIPVQTDDATGVLMRRFRVGDFVRFRQGSRVPLSFGIAPGAVGRVIEVEPHPPMTGPTYRMSVDFDGTDIPGVFRFEYELVSASDYTLKAFVESTGLKMIPNGHFVANPDADAEARPDNDMKNVPKTVGALIVVPTADMGLSNTLCARGFFPKETWQGSLCLMYRQLSDGVLRTSP